MLSLNINHMAVVACMLGYVLVANRGRLQMLRPVENVYPSNQFDK